MRGEKQRLGISNYSVHDNEFKSKSSDGREVKASCFHLIKPRRSRNHLRIRRSRSLRKRNFQSSAKCCNTFLISRTIDSFLNCISYFCASNLHKNEKFLSNSVGSGGSKLKAGTPHRMDLTVAIKPVDS